MDNMSSSSAELLDMSRFNKVTGGNNEFKEELLDIFFMNISECIKIMEKAANDNVWQNAAAELKRTSDSLGAIELSKLSTIAEAFAHESRDDKNRILDNINSNVQKLRIFVRNTRY